jgi:hypothetical protein
MRSSAAVGESRSDKSVTSSDLGLHRSRADDVERELPILIEADNPERSVPVIPLAGVGSWDT